MAVPSLGALVPGWLLILPRRHEVAMAALDPSRLAELHDFKVLIAAKLDGIFGSVCAFEHGPAAAQRLAGCGVDHAHLHLVPTSIDLRNAARPYLPIGTEWASARDGACSDAFRSGMDYLYLEQPLGDSSIVAHPEIGSQVFRRAIASALGSPDTYNWRHDRQIDNVLATIALIKSGTSLQTVGCA